MTSSLTQNIGRRFLGGRSFSSDIKRLRSNGALAPEALFLALVIALAFFGVSPAFAQQTARAKALGMKVKCMCGGCNDPAGACFHSGGEFSGPCETAKGMLKEIDAHIARGESDGEILKDFVREYGPTVLVDPPAAGFDWTAWIVPIVVPLLALGAGWFLVRRWRQELAGGPARKESNVTPEMLARVQRDVEKGEL
jgi:cytochrome c-type biogenesis protein CcmH/NrfF